MSRSEVLVATGNEHKLREFGRLLGDAFTVRGFRDVVPCPPDAIWTIEETGATFAENARLKAVHASRLTELPVVADDSGLCVDALDGRPGVHSARHGGPDLTDRQRWELVLQQMAGVPGARRGAHYLAVIVVALQGRVEAVAEGRCDGLLLEGPRGTGGFGYDPIFLVTELGKSMAELTPGEKDAISHRARALDGVRERLGELAGRG